jgi:hypothetical protein
MKNNNMLYKVGNSFARAEFSKKLAIVVTALFILTCIAAAIAKWMQKDLASILDYVQSTFTVVLVTYAGKSGTENVFKIKSGSKINDVASKLGIVIEQKEDNNGESK